MKLNELGYIAKKLSSGQNPGSGKSYTGLASSTAKVTVDNSADTIKVDIPIATEEEYGVVKLGTSFELNEQDQLSLSDSLSVDIVNGVPDNTININKIDLDDVIIDGNNIGITE